MPPPSTTTRRPGCTLPQRDVHALDQEALLLRSGQRLQIHPRARGDDGRIELVQNAAHHLGIDLGAEPHLDAELRRHDAIILDDAREIVLVREIMRGIAEQAAADPLAALVDDDLMPAPGRRRWRIPCPPDRRR